MDESKKQFLRLLVIFLILTSGLSAVLLYSWAKNQRMHKVAMEESAALAEELYSQAEKGETYYHESFNILILYQVNKDSIYMLIRNKLDSTVLPILDTRPFGLDSSDQIFTGKYVRLNGSEFFVENMTLAELNTKYSAALFLVLSYKPLQVSQKMKLEREK